MCGEGGGGGEHLGMNIYNVILRKPINGRNTG